MIHIRYMITIIIILAVSMMTIDLQEEAITECKNKHEVTKIELYDLKQQIAEGLCLPRLEIR